MNSRTNQPTNAFTIIELMTVLVVLGIAVAVIPAMMGSTDAMQARSAAEQVVAAITYAQCRTITTQSSLQIAFDSTGNSFEVQDENGTAVRLFDSDDTDYQISFCQDSGLGAVNMTSASFDGSTTLWFDHLGGPHGGTISGTPGTMTQGSVVITAGAESLTITVQPVTGEVSVN